MRGEYLNLRRALLASTGLAVVALAVATGRPARAQDATWLASPGTGDFNTAANWAPGAVPTVTAFFGTSGVTNLSFSAGSTSVGGWTFNAGAASATASRSVSPAPAS